LIDSFNLIFCAIRSRWFSSSTAMLNNLRKLPLQRSQFITHFKRYKTKLTRMSASKKMSPPLSDEFYDMLASKSQTTNIKEQLQTQGYTTNQGQGAPIPILSDEMRHTLIETLPGLFAGNFETNVYPDEWHWRAGISRPDATREMCNSWKASRTIASVVLNEQLGEFVANVMGWDSVRIAQDDVVWKPPQPMPMTQLDYIPQRRIDTVGFHQDSAYISKQFAPYDNNSVTLWIALDDADQENGCLEYAIGSHKWRPILHMEDNDSGDSDVSAFHGSDEKSYKSGIEIAYAAASDTESMTRDIRTAPVLAGHAVLHHQDVWHGSGPNMSEVRHRRALAAHYLRGDVKFMDDSDALPPFGKSSYIYGRYKRYQSVEVDESFFPIIYSRRGGGQKRTEWLKDYVCVS